MSNYDDQSTSRVIDWLNRLGKSVLRINEEDDFKIIEFDLTSIGKLNLEFSVNGVRYKLADFSSFWYRRGYLKMSYRVDIESLEDEKLKQDVSRELNNELKILKEIIYEQMEGLHSIGKIKNGQMNKFHVLIEASKLGIDIPRSSIYDNSKRVVNRFKNAKIITKAISETPIFKINNKENEEEIYTGYTSEIHLNDLEKNIEFFPSLIQEKLDKKIELRIFFLEEDFYTMAIFSQNDNKTSIDFRKYNTNKPNRTMPFNLPIEIKTKLKKLIRKLDLVSGSIDMVLTKEDRYVFLEVNPVGQFGMVSYPCNYKIEKRIAKYLAQ